MLGLSIEKKRELRVYLRILANTIGAVGLVAVLASCGTSPGYSYTIGGTVSGMVGSGMVLQNNGGDDLNISANGSFSFATALTDETVYAITVKTQPTNPDQHCWVSNGSGTVGGAPVNNVVVDCMTGPTSVAVDTSGKFAYATNTDGTISAYQINLDGTLKLGTTLTGMTYPISVTVDPSGQYAYAVDTIGGLIWIYSIDSGSGNLTNVGNVAAGAHPSSIVTVLVGSQEFAYVTNLVDNNISAYKIQNNGTLVELTNSPFQAGANPSSIVTVKLPGGDEFAYVTNAGDSTISVYSIHSSSGALNPICGGSTGNICPSTETYPTSVTVDPSGKFAYAANEMSKSISVYTIDQTYGTLTAVTSVPAGTYPTSVVTVLVGSSEFAYATNTIDGTISAYNINLLNSGALIPICGESTVIPCPSGLSYPSSIAVNNPLNGKFAYVANMGSSTISVLKINPDGTLALISP